MLTALLAQWRYAVLGLLAAGLIILGWKIADWRNDSLQLAVTKAALDAAVKQQVASDQARAKAEGDLAKARGVVETQIVEVIKRVKVVVRDNPDCNLSVAGVRLLNEAISGDVPKATGVATSTTDTSSQAGRASP